jgi:putative holliday junction resolvase
MTGGKLLGIDHGIARIGLATCDALRIAARELTVIERKSRREDFDQINAIAARENVVGVVVGLPVNDTTAPGQHTQADTVRLWAGRYAQTTNLPIRFYDEQLSSEEAIELAQAHHRAAAAPIDDLAARIILQRYIDALATGLVDDPI